MKNNKKESPSRESFRQGWEYNRDKIKWVFSKWRRHTVWLIVLFVMTIISVTAAFAYPFLFGQIVNLIRGSSQDIEFTDNHVYIADGRYGFQIFDVSDVNNPIKTGDIDIGGEARDIEMYNGYAFVAWEDVRSNEINAVKIIDLSDKSNPEIISSIEFLLEPGNMNAHIRSISISENFLFAATGKNGLKVVDISDIHNPIIVARQEVPSSADIVVVQDDLACVFDRVSGILVFNIKDPSNPILLSTFELNVRVENLTFWNDKLFISARDRFIRILDLSTPDNPSYAYTVYSPFTAFDVAIDDAYAFVACGEEGLIKLSLDNLLDNNYFEFDTKEPNEIITSVMHTSGIARSIVMGDDYAFLMAGFSGFQIIDKNLTGSASLIKHITWRDQFLRTLILIFAFVGFLRVMAAFYPSFRAMINLKIDMDVRNSAFARILRKSHRYFLRFRTGDLVMRLTDDIYDYPKISWFSCSGIFRAVESASKVLFCLAYMFTVNMTLTFIAFMPLPFMLGVFTRYQRALRDSFFDVRQAASEVNNSLESCFSGIRILKAYNGEDHQVELFNKVLEDRFTKEMRVVYLWTFIWHLYPAINMVGQVIVLGVGSWLIFQERFQVGTMYMFFVYMDMLLHPLLDIPNLFTTSRDAFACIDRQEELHKFDQRNDEDPDSGGQKIESIDLIEFIGVAYEYEKLRKDELEEQLSLSDIREITRQRAIKGEIEIVGDRESVLHDINIKITKGSKVAIVGAVGSGKTTLVKLITRITKPTQGEILINGNPADVYDIRQLRSLIGYVPQEVVLFSDSIADNVSFGREIDENDIQRVLEMAQVDKEVMAFEKGINTILGQRGQTVSGGQKQRIAIARALAGKPSLLILDDCTAALDAENEEKFWDDLKRYYPDTTCVIVTHRISTAKRADIIYVIENGTISHSGSHQDLIEKSVLYKAYQSGVPTTVE